MSANVQLNPWGEKVQPTLPSGCPVGITRSTSATTGAASTIVLDADAARSNIIAKIAGGYSATPTGGLLTVTDGGSNTYFQAPVTAAGLFNVDFNVPLVGPTNTGLTVTLAGGGGTVISYLNVVAYKLQ